MLNPTVHRRADERQDERPHRRDVLVTAGLCGLFGLSWDASARASEPVAESETTAISEPLTHLYLARSGRLSPYGSNDDMVLGGMALPADEAARAEADLKERSRAAGFRLALDVGTNRHLPAFLDLMLDAMQAYSFRIPAALVEVDMTDRTPDMLTYFRTEAEAAMLRSGEHRGQDRHVALHAVRHSRMVDDLVYRRIEERGLVSRTVLHTSHDRAPLLYQLSSTVMKCVAMGVRKEDVTGARRAMRDIVSSRFQVAREAAGTNPPGIDDVTVTRLNVRAVP